MIFFTSNTTYIHKNTIVHTMIHRKSAFTLCCLETNQILSIEHKIARLNIYISQCKQKSQIFKMAHTYTPQWHIQRCIVIRKQTHNIKQSNFHAHKQSLVSHYLTHIHTTVQYNAITEKPPFDT